MSNAKRGIFISFEGGDGAGKSTQIKKLAERLAGEGRDVVLTREPGGSEGGEEIRALLVSGDKDRWSPMTEALLMIAARRDHLEKVIEPALARGAIVITDRFADSTMAYQGLAGALGEGAASDLHRIAINAEPDLTLILDLPVEEGLARTGGRDGNEARFESKGVSFHERVRNAFLTIADKNSERCAVIDAGGSVEDSAEKIWRIVSDRLKALEGRK